jgi:type IV pilus secretin PilQ/predicted competence protein
MIPVLAVLGGILLAEAPEPVTNLSVLPSVERTEIVIEVEGEVQFRDFTMEGPNRLVLDILGARSGLSRETFPAIDRGGVRSLQVSQYSDDVVRVVVELDVPTEYQVTQGSGYLRLSLSSGAGQFEPWSSAAMLSMRPASSEPTEAETPDRREELVRTAGREIHTLPSAERFGIRQRQEAAAITVTFKEAPIEDVLFTFSEFSGRSIVPGVDVDGQVNAQIKAQPWDIALNTILSSQGWAARELDSGIIIVDNLENLASREGVVQLQTKTFRIEFSSAAEVLPPVTALLTERGNAEVSESSNTVVVMDVPRVLEDVEALIDQLDQRTPQISIAAKIIFVDRTDLLEYGVTYDLKDSQGNQLNFLTPGGIDANGDGFIDASETVEKGTDVVSLGGNSLAALGNANSRVIKPQMQFLTTLILGRYSLVNFLEALESVNLSEIQATPSVQVMDNQEARVLVGERTPLRVIDASSGAGGVGGQQQQPQATVQIEETGISLTVTPHVTAGDLILLDLAAERSSPAIGDSDVGFIFRTQEAQSRVLVRDGETVVIAGLTSTESSEVRSGIPLLMNLPVVGALFRTTRKQSIQRDLMILVTPYIERESQ